MLVPPPVWDHYQRADLSNEVYKERYGDISKLEPRKDMGGFFFLAGLGLGYLAVSAVNSQYQIPVAFAVGAGVGFAFKILID